MNWRPDGKLYKSVRIELKCYYHFDLTFGTLAELTELSLCLLFALPRAEQGQDTVATRLQLSRYFTRKLIKFPPANPFPSPWQCHRLWCRWGRAGPTTTTLCRLIKEIILTGGLTPKQPQLMGTRRTPPATAVSKGCCFEQEDHQPVSQPTTQPWKIGLKSYLKISSSLGLGLQPAKPGGLLGWGGVGAQINSIIGHN